MEKPASTDTPLPTWLYLASVLLVLAEVYFMARIADDTAAMRVAVEKATAFYGSPEQAWAMKKLREKQ